MFPPWAPSSVLAAGGVTAAPNKFGFATIRAWWDGYMRFGVCRPAR